jgi:crotonobetainyl-CoA:carnitine CoA-transferase CaiB-like acyl-CoA transferase
MLPLEGLTVVSVEQAVSAPMATRHLADLGARVIKIERPDGGDFARAYDTTVNGMASHFVWLNRSKQSLTLDLKSVACTRVLEPLLARADVFVENLAPGAAARLALDAAALRARHPSLIVCEISGYGASGPYSHKKAYDLLIQSEAGLLSITGTEESPSKAGISVADIAAGVYAFSGILAALIKRHSTGQGSTVEVNMFDALGEWMGYPAYYTAYGGVAPARSGASHAAIAPYGPFTAGDGKAVYLAIQNEREWERFCRIVLERPQLASDARFDSGPRRVQNRDELHRQIDEAFGGVTAAEIIERLDRADIANARMNSIEEFVAHPQLKARNRWRTVDSPVGPIRALVPPFLLDADEPVMGPIPAVGQDTDRILEELGIDRATIDGWRNAGMV